MDTVTLNFAGEPVTVRPQTNLTYARFQSILAKMLVIIDELATEFMTDKDELLISLAEYAQISAQCTTHVHFAASTDSVEIIREKSRVWLAANPDDYQELRNAADRVRNALVDPATSPVPLGEGADPKV